VSDVRDYINLSRGYLDPQSFDRLSRIAFEQAPQRNAISILAGCMSAKVAIDLRARGMPVVFLKDFGVN
jgi:hypothetical protein